MIGVWRAGCNGAFMVLLAAAGGALDNHALVTPTLHFPPPVWEGEGSEPQPHECLCGSHPRPTLPPQALSQVKGAWLCAAHSQSVGQRQSQVPALQQCPYHTSLTCQGWKQPDHLCCLPPGPPTRWAPG